MTITLLDGCVCVDTCDLILTFVFLSSISLKPLSKKHYYVVLFQLNVFCTCVFGRIAHSMEKLVTSLNVEDGTTFQRVTDNVGFAISCPLNLTTQGFRTAEENGTETFLVGTPAKPALGMWHE